MTDNKHKPYSELGKMLDDLARAGRSGTVDLLPKS
jgi:hypothetical protein